MTSLNTVIDEINAELMRSDRHNHEEFTSLHEAYAVILEEVDELWEHVRLKRKERSAIAIHKELIQIAAMALKAVRSMENFVGGQV